MKQESNSVEKYWFKSNKLNIYLEEICFINNYQSTKRKTQRGKESAERKAYRSRGWKKRKKLVRRKGRNLKAKALTIEKEVSH